MRYLLDTHTFLWAIDDKKKVNPTAFAQMTAATALLYLSVASLWEIAIKVSTGKLTLLLPLEPFLVEQLHRNRIEPLHITPTHALKVAELPFHHRDPFDRLILAQSLVEDLTIITKDAQFQAYHVKLLW